MLPFAVQPQQQRRNEGAARTTNKQLTLAGTETCTEDEPI